MYRWRRRWANRSDDGKFNDLFHAGYVERTSLSNCASQICWLFPVLFRVCWSRCSIPLLLDFLFEQELRNHPRRRRMSHFLLILSLRLSSPCAGLARNLKFKRRFSVRNSRQDSLWDFLEFQLFYLILLPFGFNFYTFSTIRHPFFSGVKKNGGFEQMTFI